MRSPWHQLALNAALPRILNRDILRLLVDESVANDLFEWLKELSFVVKHPEGWQYHNIVRELILRYQRRISPQEWKAQHIQLANYYDKLRKGLELTNTQNLKNETWQKYTLEWLYHNLCIDPSLQMALNDWLMALDTSNRYAQGWAEAMNMAGIASGSEDMRSWGQKFQNGLRALEKNLWFEMDEVLSELLRETCLEDNCRAIALSLQGFFPLLCFLSKYDISQVKWDTEEIPDLNKIIENLTHALNLASKSEYFAFRGFVHLLKANIVEGKADINKFLEVVEPDDILRKQVEDILNIDFNNLIYVKNYFRTYALTKRIIYEV
ncbi:hypothetical protein [Nostoc sp. FACHB-888]|uniref:hypothetical protein n=1 Tax=Nostoc sp. FACHB-888 TaxID=2692842 RepID=UPI001689A074|nr:hypothetical protein [Nostoc sp. FACHB-888]MBD2247675.1 hypothetical protein [Nostoc sp. FACHB-888]